MRLKTILSLLVLLVSCYVMIACQRPTDGREDTLLSVREAVWKSWFADDKNSLMKLVPPDAIAISAGESKWKTRTDILRSADDFHANGGRLLSLEFPKTQVQYFGDAAVVYTEYRLALEVTGKRSDSQGRATEIFVYRDGQWLNTGWHTDDFSPKQ